MDLVNLTNNDADQRFQSGGNQQYNPYFGQSTFRIGPRTVQLSVRYVF